jgi:flavin reductase (DIM6/NTAB) family NADH-FMN oxidoreductase RutF
MIIKTKDIENLDRKYRLNLINSLSGVKPANLVGTRSDVGHDNLAIISSVVHLGSNPAQLGFVMRPQKPEPKDTYLNITKSGYFTINHVAKSFIQKAHYTSAKLAYDESEFDRMNLEPEIIENFPAPFVKESSIKIGLKLLEQITLPNECIFIIGTVELISLPEDIINDLGQIDLAAANGVGLSGLNTYYSLEKEAAFPYVRNDEIPDFNAEG